MADGIEPSATPDPRGPWPEVHDLTRVFDTGWTWCVNADAHPGDSDYPDAERHLPPHECHGPQVWLDDAQLDLGSGSLDVCIYLAAPFRFGQPREGAKEPRVRLMLEAWDGDGELRARLSVDRGEACHLARVLERLVDLATPLGRAS